MSFNVKQPGWMGVNYGKRGNSSTAKLHVFLGAYGHSDPMWPERLHMITHGTPRRVRMGAVPTAVMLGEVPVCTSLVRDRG